MSIGSAPSTERHCALTERAGLGVKQLPPDVGGFEVFLAGNGVTTLGEDDLLAYLDLRDLTTPHGALAAGANRRVLVRVGATIQTMLSPVRPGHLGLTADTEVKGPSSLRARRPSG